MVGKNSRRKFEEMELDLLVFLLISAFVFVSLFTVRPGSIEALALKVFFFVLFIRYTSLFCFSMVVF